MSLDNFQPLDNQQILPPPKGQEKPSPKPAQQPEPQKAASPQDGWETGDVPGGDNSTGQRDNAGAGDFDRIDFAAFGYEGEGEDFGFAAANDNPDPGSQPQSVAMGKPAFRQLFKSAFNITGKVSRLASLEISADEGASADVAADAIYEIAEDTPALRWLIEPGNVWLQRAVAIGMFAVPKAQAVRLELAIRRKQAEEARKKRESGPTVEIKPAEGSSERPATVSTSETDGGSDDS